MCLVYTTLHVQYSCTHAWIQAEAKPGCVWQKHSVRSAPSNKAFFIYCVPCPVHQSSACRAELVLLETMSMTCRHYDSACGMNTMS